MTAIPAALDLASVRRLDAEDPFAPLRARFALPPGIVYLDGNSLGALPVATADRMRALLGEEWGEGLIRSWNLHGWVGMPRRIGDRIAPLIGAAAGEVIVADSTSTNLYKLLVAAVQGAGGRRVILSEPGNFPTDLYMAEGVARTIPGIEVRTVAPEAILDAIDANVAVVLLTHVHYKTGAMHDMAALTATAQARGALVLWDLSHSAGAVPVDLNGCGADLAVGCGYKYLNGGPGAPAFLFVAARHQDRLRSPLSGWFGHAAAFEFRDEYRPAPGIERFLCGTPPILGMAALDQGIASFAGTDMAGLWRKSRALSELFVALMAARCAGQGFTLLSPPDPARRGSHLSYAHPEAFAICQALIARGVIGDFRAPDALRLGFTPLYTRFEDVWRAVDAIDAVMREGAWRLPEHRAARAVT